ncbi:hypothetical protein QBC47DRAFT_414422 [Echria macrotheca]|uniref:BZIP domain-containing protein n=1 Tax=Echria macrotheca TaxID=438768 RepID=A0AAJ0BCC5_9PEZI|nr:hypothetical protein QBC47DRAFT_414422 [Echria macrotheca]
MPTTPAPARPAAPRTNAPGPAPPAPPSGRSRAGRPPSNSYIDLMKPGEDWTDLDATERRKIKNRLAQRAYRRNMRDRTKEIEILRSQIKDLQQATATTTTSSSSSTAEKHPYPTPDSPSSSSAAAMSPPPAGAAATMSDRDWMLSTSCLDWTTTTSAAADMGGTSPGIMTTDPDDIKPGIAISTSLGSMSLSSADCHHPGLYHTPNCWPPPPPPPPPATTSSHTTSLHTGSGHPPPPPTTFPSPTPRSGMTADDILMDNHHSFHHRRTYIPPSPPLIPSTTPPMGHILPHPIPPSSRGTPTPGPGPEGCVCSSAMHTPDASEPLIHLAVAHGNLHTLRFLLRDCHVPVDMRDKAGYTPLQRAVITGRTDMVALLIQHGADPS